LQSGAQGIPLRNAREHSVYFYLDSRSHSGQRRAFRVRFVPGDATKPIIRATALEEFEVLPMLFAAPQ